MTINSTVPSSNVPQPTPSPVTPSGRQNSGIKGEDAPLPSIAEDNSEFPGEDVVQRGVDSARQSILQQSNLAMLSQGNLSPATVFSLLQD
ncbi:MAG TPA: hypothetical protein VFC44_01610 [Candidatus Saccharimonadales bacterium]|nr:hypothetical protein [Candidatus Saccharimonadales bacterium]